MKKIVRFLGYTFIYLFITSIAPWIWKNFVYPDSAGDFFDRGVYVLLLVSSVYIMLPWYLSKINNITYKQAKKDMIDSYKDLFKFKKEKEPRNGNSCLP